MLWQYARASYFFRAAVWVAFWSLLPATYAVTTYVQIHRRLKGYYPSKARVIEKLKAGSRSEPRIRIEYRDVERHLHNVRISVSRPEYRSLAAGDEVPVYVSEMEPADAWLMSGGKPGYRGMRIAGVLAALLLLPVIAATLRARRRVQVLWHGHPLAGQVRKVVRDKPNRLRTPYDYVVVYGYTAPAGTSYERRSAGVRKPLADRWRKRVRIPVYFDPAHPERAEADVYEFRKPG
jgi:hypothetical protein